MRSICFHVLQYLKVTFDPDTGLLSSLSNLETKQTIKLTQNFYWSVCLLTAHRVKTQTGWFEPSSQTTCQWLLTIGCLMFQVQRQCWEQWELSDVRCLHFQAKLFHTRHRQQGGQGAELSGREWAMSQLFYFTLKYWLWNYKSNVFFASCNPRHQWCRRSGSGFLPGCLRWFVSTLTAKLWSWSGLSDLCLYCELDFISKIKCGKIFWSFIVMQSLFFWQLMYLYTWFLKSTTWSHNDTLH